MTSDNVSTAYGTSKLRSFDRPHHATTGFSRMIVTSPEPVSTRIAPAYTYPTIVGTARNSAFTVAPRDGSAASAQGNTLPPDSPSFPTSYSLDLVDQNSAYFRPLLTIGSSGGSSIYDGDSSATTSSKSNASPFELQRLPQTATLTGTSDPYFGDFVAPSSLQDAPQSDFGFSYPAWTTDVKMDADLVDPVSLGFSKSIGPVAEVIIMPFCIPVGRTSEN